MKNRDSIMMHPFALIALAVVTVSTPLGAQVVGGRVRVFSADTTSVGQIIDLSDEGFVFENDELRRPFAYRDLDRLEASNGIRSWMLQGIAIGSVFGVLAGFGERPEDDGLVFDIGNALEGMGIGALLGGLLGHYLVDNLVEYESWEPISVRDYFVPLLGDEFPHGGRVRVSVDGSELIGRATAMTEEGFEVVQGGMRRSFAYRDIDGLDWSRGVHSHWKTGLGLGLLGGFIAFPTFNGAWGCVASDWEGPSCEEKGEDAISWIGAGGLLGLGVGTLVWRHESWEPYGLGGNRPGISPPVALGPIGTGDRVRVTIAGERMIGEVVRMGPDGYEIDLESSGLVSVTLREMEQLQRSVGVGTRGRLGLLVGGLVGLVAGDAIRDAREERTANDGSFLVIGAAVGGVAGLGVGSLFEAEQWVTVWDPPDRRTDMTLTPVIDVRPGPGGRLGAILGGRIRF